MFCLATRDSDIHTEIHSRLANAENAFMCDARRAKRGIAIVSRPSLCPPVRLNVTLRYRRHISWVTSKVISRIISLGFSLLEPQHRQPSPRGTP